MRQRGGLRLFHLALSIGMCWIWVETGFGFDAKHSDRNRLPASVVFNGPSTSNKIALTFDACPGTEVTFDREVIHALERTGTPATLFLSGKWMERFPEATRELAKNPMWELGFHGHAHYDLTSPNVSQKLFEREFDSGARVFKRLTGKDPKLFRPPYATVDRKIALAAEKRGLLTIEYDIASGDPDPKLSKRALVENVVSRAKPGSIIIFHMNGKGKHTARALPEIIQRLKARGFEFVTVSELNVDRAPAASRPTPPVSHTSETP